MTQSKPGPLPGGPDSLTRTPGLLRHRTGFAAALAVLGLLAAVAPAAQARHGAAGGGAGADPAPIAPAATTPPPAPPAALTAATPAIPAAPVDHPIAVGGFAFAPAPVTINQGDSVVWTWSGPDVNHTVTARAGQAESFDSHPGVAAGAVAAPPGASFRHRFTALGTFTYLCRVHTGMTGSVTVVAAGAAAPAAATTTPAPAPTPAPPAAKAAAKHAVRVAGYAFGPTRLKIKTGDSVTWSWTGSDRDHSVTSAPGQADKFDSHAGVRTAQISGPPTGGNFTHVFAKPGTFHYLCRVHPGMTGTVVVGAAARARVRALGARRTGAVVLLRYHVDRSAPLLATISSHGRPVLRYVFMARRGIHLRRLTIPRHALHSRLVVAVQVTTLGRPSLRTIAAVR